MGFVQVCTALYDYAPQDEGELELKEGELVYILGKSEEEDWSKAKKKAVNDDEEEPVGLVPNNYVEEAQPLYQAKALYDYTKQTEEEISVKEDAVVFVYDTSDPDWSLVGFDEEFGFAPANYIEEIEGEGEEQVSAPVLPSRPIVPETTAILEHESPTIHKPAANLASIISKQGILKPNKTVQFTPDASEDEAAPPVLPQRPISEQFDQAASRTATSPKIIGSPPLPPLPQMITKQAPIYRKLSPDRSGIVESPPLNRAVRSASRHDGFPAPGGFHLYNINEMVSIGGKQKKMPTTLGINLATGRILISPEKERDGPQQDWTAEKLKHYSIEGKHVFMELVQPSRSIDFHAGAKDTATEIVSSLGELAGISKAEGLREVIAASKGQMQKKGYMLYDFVAQVDDEVTVAERDAVIILDDTSSEEWWKVRRVKNGKEGVVPSSYVDIDGADHLSLPDPSISGINSGKSMVEQNRMEEERLTREALKSAQRQDARESKLSEVGPGLRLPNRGSSLVSQTSNNGFPSQKSKRESRARAEAAKTKPNVSKVRTWTDHSGTFKVEAQFLALKEGKIHLHKLNGIKIAVPVIKMSMEDIDYVEQVTSQSLDDSKSPSSTKQRPSKQTNGSGARIEKKPDYDWFDFFLRSGVSPYQCERYSHNFNKDSIDEAILADLTPEILRNLGLKEGDIIRVMKYLDTTYSRLKQSKRQDTGATNEVGVVDEGGLFSGAGGALKNNTRKGRPAPPVQTNDIIDLKKFQQGDFIKPPVPEKDFLDASDAPPLPAKDTRGGFDDNAWDVKPLNKGQAARSPGIGKSPTTPTTSVAIEPPVAKQQLTGAMKDLSLLDEPLVPIVTHTGASTQTRYSSANGAQAQPQPASLQQFTQSQPVGASSVLFNQLVASQPTGVAQQPMQNQSTGLGMMMQPTSQFQSQPLPRQRPQAPTIPQQYGGIMPPPPIRPVSAPLIAQQQQHSFALPPLQPQLTGMPYQNTGFGVNPQQTLNDMAQIRAQQQTNSPPLQHQFTGFPNQQINTQPLQMQQTGFNQGLHPQMTGIPQQNPYLLGQQIGSPFADPRYGTQQLQPQMTGYGSQNPLSPTYYQPLAPQQTGGINSILPAPLQPQITGINGSLNRPLFGQPPVPPIPSVFQSNGPLPTLSYPLSMQSMPTGQPMLSPLQPQKTGPAPNISFGLQPEVPKLVAQPTGRRANLSQATPNNPFGFQAVAK